MNLCFRSLLDCRIVGGRLGNKGGVVGGEEVVMGEVMMVVVMMVVGVMLTTNTTKPHLTHFSILKFAHWVQSVTGHHKQP